MLGPVDRARRHGREGLAFVVDRNAVDDWAREQRRRLDLYAARGTGSLQRREEAVTDRVARDEHTPGRLVRRCRQRVPGGGDGCTYAFVRYRSGHALGRFKQIDVQEAVWRARLPAVVDPDDEGEPDLPNEHDVRERRHLRLVSPPA